MALTQTQKIVTGTVAAALVLGFAYKFGPKLLKKADQIKNLKARLFFTPTFDRVHGLIKETTSVRIFIRFAIANQSGFNLKIDNVWALIETSDDAGKTWKNVGMSPTRLSSIAMPDNKTVSGTMPIDFKPAILSELLKNGVKLRVTTNYDFSGLPQKDISEMDYNKTRDNIIAGIRKALGLGNVQPIKAQLI